MVLDFLFFHKWMPLLCLHLKKLPKQLAKQNENWETDIMLFSLYYLIQGFFLKYLNNTPCQTNGESEIAGYLDHDNFTIFKWIIIFQIFGSW